MSRAASSITGPEVMTSVTPKNTSGDTPQLRERVSVEGVRGAVRGRMDKNKETTAKTDTGSRTGGPVEKMAKGEVKGREGYSGNLVDGTRLVEIRPGEGLETGVSEQREKGKLDPALKEELLRIVPEEDRKLLSAILQRSEQRGIDIVERTDDKKGASFKYGHREIHIDLETARAHPEVFVWDTLHEYMHVYRKFISPEHFEDTKAFALKMIEEEFNISRDVVRKKMRHEQKTGKAGDAIVPLEYEYKREYARQKENIDKANPEMDNKQQEKLAHENASAVLWDKLQKGYEVKSGEIEFTTARGISFREHYEYIHMVYHTVAPGEREYVPELLQPMVSERRIDAAFKKGGAIVRDRDDVAQKIKEMRDDNLIRTDQVSRLLERWELLKSDGGMVETDGEASIRDYTRRAFLSDKEKVDATTVVRILTGDIGLAELYNEVRGTLGERADPQRLKVLRDLIPYVIDAYALDHDEIEDIRRPWKELTSRFGRLEESERGEILRIDKKTLYKILMKDGHIDPMEIEISDRVSMGPYRIGASGAILEYAPEFLSDKAEIFVLSAVKPPEEYEHFKRMELHRENGFIVENIDGTTREIPGLSDEAINALNKQTATTRWLVYSGEIEAEKLRYLFNARTLEATRELQWNIRKYSLSTMQSLDDVVELGREGQAEFVVHFCGGRSRQEAIESLTELRDHIQKNAKAIDSCWSRVKSRLKDDPDTHDTRMRLREMEKERGAAFQILKFSLYQLENIKELSDVGIQQAFSLAENLLIFRDFCVLLPRVVPFPERKDWSQSQLPEGAIASPQEIVHQYIAAAHERQSWVLARDARSGCPIPQSAHNGALVGRSGPIRFKEYLLALICQIGIGENPVVFTDPRDLEAYRTMGRALELQENTKTYVIGPYQGHFNFLDSVMTYDPEALRRLEVRLKEIEGKLEGKIPLGVGDDNDRLRKSLQQHVREYRYESLCKEFCNKGASDMASDMIRETIHAKALEQSGVRSTGGDAHAQTILTAAIIHLRVNSPEATFYELTQLIQSRTRLFSSVTLGDADEAHGILNRDVRDSAPNSEQSTLAYDLLRTVGARFSTPSVQRLTSSSDFRIEEFSGELDESRSFVLPLKKRPVIFANFHTETDNTHTFPQGTMFAHSVARGIDNRQRLMRLMDLDVDIVTHMITENLGRGALSDLFYNTPAGLALTALMKSISSARDVDRERLESIIMHKINGRDPKFLSEFIGSTLQELDTSTVSMQEVATRNKSLNASTIHLAATRSSASAESKQVSESKSSRENPGPHTYSEHVRRAAGERGAFILAPDRAVAYTQLEPGFASEDKDGKLHHVYRVFRRQAKEIARERGIVTDVRNTSQKRDGVVDPEKVKAGLLARMEDIRVKLNDETNLAVSEFRNVAFLQKLEKGAIETAAIAAKWHALEGNNDPWPNILNQWYRIIEEGNGERKVVIQFGGKRSDEMDATA